MLEKVRQASVISISINWFYSAVELNFLSPFVGKDRRCAQPVKHADSANAKAENKALYVVSLSFMYRMLE